MLKNMDRTVSTAADLLSLHHLHNPPQSSFQHRQDHNSSHRHQSNSLSISLGSSLFASSRIPLSPVVKVELQNQALWRQFHAETTEMIITKSGRRMFPSMQISMSGFEKRARYYVLIEIIPASHRRQKYIGGNDVDAASKRNSCRGWTSAGPAESQSYLDRRVYLHPDSPGTGAYWMQHPINFNKLKLTNNNVDHRHNHVVLTSMHKYIPKIWIIRCDEAKTLSELYTHPSSSYIFEETEFIAVTAYQNENITKLKIDNNPFAKGFRETGQSRCKRKFQQVDSDRTDDDESNGYSDPELTRSVASNPDDAPLQRKRTMIDDGNSEDLNKPSSYRDSGILPNSIVPARNTTSTEESNRAVSPRLHRPWLDSSSPEAKLDPPPIPSASTSSLALPPSASYDINRPCHMHYFSTPYFVEQEWRKYRYCDMFKCFMYHHP